MRWASPPRTRELWTFGIIAVAPVLWVAASVLPRIWHFGIDDASISYAFARHWAEGNGLTASVGGPEVEGYSNFSWVALLTLVRLAGITDLHLAAKVLGVAFTAVGLAFGLAAVPALEGRVRDRTWTYGLPALALVLWPPVMVWAVAGLEGPLFGAALAAAVALDAREVRAPQRFPYSALALFLVCVSRPEGPMYALALSALKMWDALSQRRHRRQWLRFAIILGALYGTYHVWHWLTFHDLLPNTYYAKIDERSPDLWSRGWTYLKNIAVDDGLAVLLPLALLGTPRKARLALAIWSVPIGAAFFAVYAGGDWMPHGRFVQYGLPVYAILVLLGVRRLARIVLPLRPHVAVEACIALAVASIPFVDTTYSEERMEVYAAAERNHWCMYCDVMVVERSLQDEAAALDIPFYSQVAFDYGAAAYESTESRYAFDLGGLCDRTVARIRWDAPADVRGPTERAIAVRQYLLHEQDRPPTFLSFKLNFWDTLTTTTEHRVAYYALPHAPFARINREHHAYVHRGTFADLYPPHRRLRFTPIGEDLRLVGASLRDGRITITIARRPERPPAPFRVRVRARDGRSWSALALRGRLDLLRQWEAGEPLAFTFDVGRDVDPATLELVVGGAPPLPLDPDAGRDDWWLATSWPTNLPPALDPTLARLAPRVVGLASAREQARDFRLRDPDTASALVTRGRALRDAGDRDQAYLALVWARALDPSLDAALDEEIITLRGAPSNHAYAMEVALLEALYESGDPAWAARLAGHYERLGDDAKATWIMDVAGAGRARSRPHAPPGVDGDFESEGLAGWRGDRAIMRSARSIPMRVFTGHRGDRALASVGTTGASFGAALFEQGRLISAPFEIDGDVLSFMLGGIGAQASVELVEGDAVLRTSSGRLERDLRAVFWDVSDLRGHTVQLRLTDAGRTSTLIVDDFLIWD